MVWMVRLCAALFLGLARLVSVSSARSNNPSQSPNEEILKCRLVEKIARKLNLVDENAPPKLCDIRWDKHQVVQRKFKPTSSRYYTLLTTIADSRLKKVRDQDKRFLLLSGKGLKDAAIPIMIRLNNHNFALRSGLKGLEMFWVHHDNDPPLICVMDENPESLCSEPIPLTSIAVVLPFPKALEEFNLEEYLLPARQGNNDSGPFYDYLFFERLTTPKSNLPFGLLNKPFGASQRAYSLSNLHEDASNIFSNMKIHAGFLAVLLFQTLLAYDSKIGQNFQTSEMKRLLKALKRTKKRVKAPRIAKLIKRADDLLVDHGENHDDVIIDNTLRQLFIKELWLKEHFLLPEHQTFYPISIRNIGLNEDEDISIKILPLQADKSQKVIEKRIIINDEHNFHLFACIYDETYKPFGIFFERIAGYDITLLEKLGVGTLPIVMGKMESKVHMNTGGGVYFYRYQPSRIIEVNNS